MTATLRARIETLERRTRMEPAGATWWDFMELAWAEHEDRDPAPGARERVELARHDSKWAWMFAVVADPEEDEAR